VAIAVTTVLVAVVALFNVDDVSSAALTDDGFDLAACALFLAAAILRLARWRTTTDPHSLLLAGAMAVLGLLSAPTENIAGQVLHGPLEPTATVAVHAVGSALCLALALRAMTIADQGTPTRWLRTVVVAALAAVAGSAALAALFAIGSTTLAPRALWHLGVDVGLACSWLVLGLAATQRDARQPWAGRVAPLYGSLGVVELLHGLDRIQPGSWSLPAAALLGSVAMVTAHGAYVDLMESSRFTSAVDRRTGQLASRSDAVPLDVLGAVDQPVDFEVSDVVGDLARRLRSSGQEVRVRGGRGVAHARPDDLAAALDRLLANALTFAPHSPVTLHIVAIASRVEVSVSDRGPGMSAATADLAFGSAEAGRGSGLGLHVARALMARNGGRLELRNRIGGSTFVVSLPAAADQRIAPRSPAWDVSSQSA
jgi:anti-sigma regulatory factor (Ser/Thr protein kinase)